MKRKGNLKVHLETFLDMPAILFKIAFPMFLMAEEIKSFNVENTPSFLWKEHCTGAEEPAWTATTRLCPDPLRKHSPLRSPCECSFFTNQSVHFWYFDIIFASLTPSIEWSPGAVVCLVVLWLPTVWWSDISTWHRYKCSSRLFQVWRLQPGKEPG